MKESACVMKSRTSIMEESKRILREIAEELREKPVKPPVPCIKKLVHTITETETGFHLEME